MQKRNSVQKLDQRFEVLWGLLPLLEVKKVPLQVGIAISWSADQKNFEILKFTNKYGVST